MSNRWKGGFIQAYFDPLTEGPLEDFGPIYAVGYNNVGQLFLGDTTDRFTWTATNTGSSWVTASTGGTSLYNFSFAIKSNGSIWAAGDGEYGGNGQPTDVDYSSPVQLGVETTWDKVGSGSGIHLL
jgi:alpha-tubulin suppressor-like RCC1 family protein